jgi:hypothetical protein
MKYRVALPVRSRMSSLALLVVLGVAACGGDGDAITATTTTTSGAAGNGPGGQGGSVGANGGEGGAGANGGAGGVAGECGNDVVDDGEECDGTSDCNPDCTLIDDADADGISDEDEGASAGTDSDGDLTPDYQDSDSDDDGIPDSVEAGDGDIGSPPIDSDGDTVPDYADTDSDDDGILDAVEAGPSPATPLDSDGDFTPDYRDVDADNDDLSDADEVAAGTQPLDPDSDGDTISDGDEGTVDSDGDLTIDALDVDSDGDGHLDSAEAGDGDWQTLPADTDFDGIPDFVDLDSEQDGLPDIQEVDCPALGYDGRLWEDSDFDGYPDLAEALVGSDPCDDMENVHDLGVEFFFILPYMGLEQTAPLRFDPTVKEADVFFNVDTTGSMGGEIANLKSGLNTIISETTSRVSYPAFGVASWEDWPVNPYGSSAFADRPFTLLQGVTTDTAAITTGVNALATGDGNDFPEAGYESLYQVGNGSGVFGTGGNFGPFTTAGRIGGARFRPGALPIVFHITDALSHDASIPSTYAGCTSWTPDYPAAYNDHNQAQALAALTAIGARVITVQTLYPAGTCNTPVNNGITGQTQQISQTTGAVVPKCAFQTGTDPANPAHWRCGINTCCSGTIASGNTCVLRYTIAENGSGLTSAATDGIDAIIKYTTFNVFSAERDDGNVATVDTSLFLNRVEANAPDATFKPPVEPERSCTPVPTPGMFNSVAYNDGFNGFAVGSSLVTQEGAKLFFTVAAQNNIVPEALAPQLFQAYIDIVDDTTGAVLDTQEVVIIVPAAPGGAGD